MQLNVYESCYNRSYPRKIFCGASGSSKIMFVTNMVHLGGTRLAVSSSFCIQQNDHVLWRIRNSSFGNMHGVPFTPIIGRLDYDSQKTSNNILAEESGHGPQNHRDGLSRVDLGEKLPVAITNAERVKLGSRTFPLCFSLGIDLGDSRTGVAISKGFAPRPLEVVELRGQKLMDYLMSIAEREKANEFIVGLPKSISGSETQQSHKVRSFAGRLAVLAAQRCYRVYLCDEFGSSADALDYMLMMGSTKKSRRTLLDAYAAVMLLQSYFENAGANVELVVPKQRRLREGVQISDSNDDVIV